MKKKFFEEHRGLLKKVGCLALAVMIAGTGLVTYRNSVKTDIPELTVYIDPDTATVAEDDVPLAAGTSTTKKVTTKTTTKKTKMSKAAAKTATTTKKSTKTTNKTQKSAAVQVKTNTKVATTVKTSTKKKSNIKTTKTTVVTTVTTTTTSTAAASTSAAGAKTTTTAASATAANVSASGSYNVKSVATACDARVLNAFTQMGCQLVVDPNVSYSGCFDASKRTITMKALNSTVYHELGHFVEFTGGTSAVKQAIASAYSTEKSLYTAYNKAYVLQNSSEYFAESFKNYCENPAALQQARPNTYNAIVLALNNITEARVNTIVSVYSAIWK